MLVLLVGRLWQSLQQNPMVGGHDMLPSMNIVREAMNSNDHTTLVAAVKAAGLVTLSKAWPIYSIPRQPTKRSQSFPRARWTIW